MSHIESENPYVGPLSDHIINGDEMDSNFPPDTYIKLETVLYALILIRPNLVREQVDRFEGVRRVVTDSMGEILRYGEHRI